MTKQEAGQLYYINKEIRMWRRELNKLKSKSLIKGQELTGMPHVQGTSDKLPDMVIKELEIEEKIKELEYKASVQRITIMRFIEGIENSYDRQIVWLRAACCLPWRAIADEMGGENTEDGVRMRYGRLFMR